MPSNIALGNTTRLMIVLSTVAAWLEGRPACFKWKALEKEQRVARLTKVRAAAEDIHQTLVKVRYKVVSFFSPRLVPLLVRNEVIPS